MSLGEFLTTKEIAAKLKVSVARVRQFVMQERIKPVQKVGNVNFYKQDEVEKLCKLPRKTGRPKKLS